MRFGAPRQAYPEAEEARPEAVGKLLFVTTWIFQAKIKYENNNSHKKTIFPLCCTKLERTADNLGSHESAVEGLEGLHDALTNLAKNVLDAIEIGCLLPEKIKHCIKLLVQEPPRNKEVLGGRAGAR